VAEHSEGVIIVGLDGSTKDDRAVDWAAQEAALRGTGLHLVHAVHLSPEASAMGLAAAVETERTIVDKASQRVRDQHPETQVTVETVMEGPTALLVKASERAGLLVLGARGLGRIAGRLLGSVSQKVAAHAHCPVVVVRDVTSPPAGPVIVGVPPEGAPTEVLAFAFEHAARRGLPVRLIHAESPRQLEIYNPEVQGILAQAAERATALRAEQLAGDVKEWSERYPDVGVEMEQVLAHPIEVLTEQAAGASLLVVGSRGRRGLAGMGLGSVVRGVLHEAPVTAVVQVGR
jgi:nucleotide-binding universal stress UspA family protein